MVYYTIMSKRERGEFSLERSAVPQPDPVQIRADSAVGADHRPLSALAAVRALRGGGLGLAAAWKGAAARDALGKPHRPLPQRGYPGGPRAGQPRARRSGAQRQGRLDRVRHLQQGRRVGQPHQNQPARRRGAQRRRHQHRRHAASLQGHDHRKAPAAGGKAHRRRQTRLPLRDAAGAERVPDFSAAAARAVLPGGSDADRARLCRAPRAGVVLLFLDAPARPLRL